MIVLAETVLQSVRTEEIRRGLRPTAAAPIHRFHLQRAIPLTGETDLERWRHAAANIVESRVRSGSTDSAWIWGTNPHKGAAHLSTCLSGPCWSAPKGNGNGNGQAPAPRETIEDERREIEERRARNTVENAASPEYVKGILQKIGESIGRRAAAFEPKDLTAERARQNAAMEAAGG